MELLIHFIFYLHFLKTYISIGIFCLTLKKKKITSLYKQNKIIYLILRIAVKITEDTMQLLQ